MKPITKSLIIVLFVSLLAGACSKDDSEEQKNQEDTQLLLSKLSFVGAGASVTIDSVRIENINIGKKISLKGGEALNLVSSIPVNTKGLKYLQYTLRDKLRITGKSGIYTTTISKQANDSEIITITFVACSDAEGYNYPVVKIGDQFWMAENLKTTKYHNGTSIPYISDFSEWYKHRTAAYCYYENNKSYRDVYGILYNWYTLTNNSIAPKGWHVPSLIEWKTLMESIGGQDQIKGMLKEAGTTHWLSPNLGSTNSTGFTALPGGRKNWAEFWGVGRNAELWSSNETEDKYGIPLLHAVSISLDNSSYSAVKIIFDDDKRHGLSVRCLKD